MLKATKITPSGASSLRAEIEGKGIRFEKYEPNSADHQKTASLVECYRDVFADHPWNEWMKCGNPNCTAHWGVRDKASLARAGYLHCDVPVVDYWPRNTVWSDLRSEITADTLCTLALDQSSEIVGFCWGYPIKVRELEAKLQISFAHRVAEFFGEQESVGYQDEVGVVPQYRGAKLAKVLNAERINDFCRRGLSVAVSRARRTPEPSVTYLWYTGKLGYKVLAEYPGEDGRVILGRKLHGLAELL